MFSTCSLLGNCCGITCWAWELQAWWAFTLLNKGGSTVLSAELGCSCTQVELIPSFGIPWDRGEGWSIPWQFHGAELLQCYEHLLMQSIDFSMCKQQL